MTMVAGALFFFTASVFFYARLRSHVDHRWRTGIVEAYDLSSRIDGPIFFMMSGCTGKETDPGCHVADDFGGANSKCKKGGVSFVFAAALVFISGWVGTSGLCPVIVH